MKKFIKKIGDNKKAIIISIITIIFVGLFYVYTYFYLDPKIFKKIDDTSRFLSEIATVAGVGGVFYAVKSFKKSEKDSRQTERSELMRNSIEVLKIFSGTIIPQSEESSRKQRKVYKESVSQYKERVYAKENKKLDKLPQELEENIRINSKIRSGTIGIFNQLEQVCAYVAHGLIIEDVVYPTVNNFFLDFCKNNEDLLSFITKEDVPYKNLHYVKNKWNTRANKDSLERQRQKVDEELSKLDTN